MMTMMNSHFKEELVTKLNNAFNNKKRWEVRKAEGQQQTATPLIIRLLSIRHFELEVARNIQSHFGDDSLTEVYSTFVNDEKVHDEQLRELAIHYGCEDSKPPVELMERFQQLKQTTDLLLLNYLLEQVFIVTLPRLQREGDVFANYVASWILRDEALHTAFGRYYVLANGVEIPVEPLKFCVDVIRYVFGDSQKELTTFVKNLKSAEFDLQHAKEQLIVPPRVSFFENSSILY